MSNRHAKKKPKPTIEQFMRDKVRQIQSAFTVPMRVTIIARYPALLDELEALRAATQEQADAPRGKA